MLLLCLGTGVGVTDCHSQCTHWLRNDTGFCMGCGGAGDRKGRPYGENVPVKMSRRVCRPQAENLCVRHTEGLLAEKSEIFRQGRRRGCPGMGQPL